MSRVIEERIAATAAAQHGVITLAQLVDAGLPATRVLRRVHAGQLRRMHRGVYHVGPVVLPWAPAMAAVLAVGPNAWLGRLHALALWELIEPVAAGTPIHVMVAGANRASRSGIMVHRVTSLDADEHTVRAGIPVTSVTRTLLDVAGILGRRELETVFAKGERTGQVDSVSLLGLLDRRPRRPGAPVLRELASAATGPALTRSPLEREFLLLIDRGGLPAPHTNVTFGPYELDGLWPDVGLAVELDGFAHHRTRGRFEGDKQKDSWLLSRGITVLRLSWRQITQRPVPTVVQIGQALARAAAERAAR